MCDYASAPQGLTPQCVPSWHRVRAANLLAHNGSEWVRFFKMYNSGTYNNQYMVSLTQNWVNF